MPPGRAALSAIPLYQLMIALQARHVFNADTRCWSLPAVIRSYRLAFKAVHPRMTQRFRLAVPRKVRLNRFERPVTHCLAELRVFGRNGCPRPRVRLFQEHGAVAVRLWEPI
jgi:hypothetical protein